MRSRCASPLPAHLDWRCSMERLASLTPSHVMRALALAPCRRVETRRCTVLLRGAMQTWCGCCWRRGPTRRRPTTRWGGPGRVRGAGCNARDKVRGQGPARAWRRAVAEARSRLAALRNGAPLPLRLHHMARARSRRPRPCAGDGPSPMYIALHQDPSPCTVGTAFRVAVATCGIGLPHKQPGQVPVALETMFK